MEPDNTELKKRKEDFMEEYKALIDKYGVDFVALPVFVPTQTGVFEVRLQMHLADTRGVPVKSPFIM
jgi:hypothetical protein